MTHWAWIALGLVVLGLVAEAKEEVKATFRDSLLNIGSNIAMGIVAGVCVLYAEDTTVLDESARLYGETMMQIGNVILHFLPALFFWLLILSCDRVDTRYDYIIALEDPALFSAFNIAHLFLPFSFFMAYAYFFDPREEYGVGVSEVSMGFSMLSATCINHIVFTQLVVWRSFTPIHLRK